ncbi:MAG: preprotein translocase subunit YajC, partial [Oscillospiraceae bacterium]|nr:preprotein translocase subunit YajC [Oscillospiraceae bacterium]
MNILMEAQSGGFGGGNSITLVIYLVAIIGVFYFLMIRPERKRKKKADEMRNSLAVGMEIT